MADQFSTALGDRRGVGADGSAPESPSGAEPVSAMEFIDGRLLALVRLHALYDRHSLTQVEYDAKSHAIAEEILARVDELDADGAFDIIELVAQLKSANHFLSDDARNLKTALLTRI